MRLSNEPSFKKEREQMETLAKEAAPKKVKSEKDFHSRFELVKNYLSIAS